MAITSFLRSITSNPNKITPKSILYPCQTLITRQFSSKRSKPTSKKPDSKKPDSKKPDSHIENVKELFKMRTEGMFVSAAKVFDKISKRLRPFQNNRKFTHEAMDKSRGQGRIPEELPHIAVIEAYANAGETSCSAYKVYLKMLGPKVVPNEHTYNGLIELLALSSDGDWVMIEQAQKYVIEMLDKGMRPGVGASVALFKAFVEEGKIKEGREFLMDIKKRGFLVETKLFKEVVKGEGGPVKVIEGKGGNVVKGVLEILFDKKI